MEGGQWIQLLAGQVHPGQTPPRCDLQLSPHAENVCSRVSAQNGSSGPGMNGALWSGVTFVRVMVTSD